MDLNTNGNVCSSSFQHSFTLHRQQVPAPAPHPYTRRTLLPQPQQQPHFSINPWNCSSRRTFDTMNSAVTTQQLQDNVDACLHQLSREWNAPFMFELAPFSPCDHNIDSFNIKTRLQPCDISKLLGGQCRKYTRLYFCPDTYPPHPSCPRPAAGGPTTSPSTHNQPIGGSMTVAGMQSDSDGTANTTHNDPPPSFLALKNDLASAAFTQCNFGLISNGGSSRQAKSPYRRFVCRDAQNRANTKYATSRKTMIQIAQGSNLLRASKLVNNRSGDRKDGKSKPRRTTTNFGYNSCTFCFNVRWDCLGLYISLEKNGGCPTHRFHVRSTASSLPTRLLGADERETLGHLAAVAIQASQLLLLLQPSLLLLLSGSRR
jgi:hypothetical protein